MFPDVAVPRMSGWLKPDLRGIKYSSAGRMVETLRGEPLGREKASRCSSAVGLAELSYDML